MRNTCECRVNDPCETLQNLRVGYIHVGQSIPCHVVRSSERVGWIARCDLKFCWNISYKWIWILNVNNGHSYLSQGNWGTIQLCTQVIGPKSVDRARATDGAEYGIEISCNGAGGPLIIECLASESAVSVVTCESAGVSTVNSDSKVHWFHFDIALIWTYCLARCGACQATVFISIPKGVHVINGNTRIISIKTKHSALKRHTRTSSGDINVSMPSDQSRGVKPVEFIILSFITCSKNNIVRNRLFIWCTVSSWKDGSDCVYSSVHTKVVIRCTHRVVCARGAIQMSFSLQHSKCEDSHGDVS